MLTADRNKTHIIVNTIHLYIPSLRKESEIQFPVVAILK